jgi:predicted dehydrogenase
LSEFRWGILGTGFVARKFVLGLRAARGASAVVVGSRSRDKAQAFARDFGIPRAYESYERALGDPEVDAFYVATPPHLHREHALLCLAAGRPVLVEKPFTLSAREASDVVEAARSRGVFCMEAMWTRFLPLVRRVKRLVDAGELGELRLVSGSFGLPERVDPDSGLFDPVRGGGALLDRGVYPLSLALHLSGPAREVQGRAVVGTTGVDEEVAITLRHENGALALLFASLRTACPNDLQVMGSRATVRIHAPIYRPFRMSLAPVVPRGRVDSGGSAVREALRESGMVHGAFQRLSGVAAGLRRHAKHSLDPYAGNGYHYQAEEVMRCVRAGAGESPIMPLAQSVAIMEAIDSLRSGWASDKAGVGLARSPAQGQQGTP